MKQKEAPAQAINIITPTNTKTRIKFDTEIQQRQYLNLLKDYEQLQTIIDHADEKKCETIKSFVYYYANHKPTKQVFENFFEFMRNSKIYESK